MLKSLDCVISHHPSSLAHVLQAHLVTLIEGTLADDLRGLELLLKLLVRHDMDAEELIEGIKTANETVLRHAKAAREASPEKLEQILKIYGAFVITWTSGSSVDKNMASCSLLVTRSILSILKYSTARLSYHQPGKDRTVECLGSVSIEPVCNKVRGDVPCVGEYIENIFGPNIHYWNASHGGSRPTMCFTQQRSHQHFPSFSFAAIVF